MGSGFKSLVGHTKYGPKAVFSLIPPTDRPIQAAEAPQQKISNDLFLLPESPRGIEATYNRKGTRHGEEFTDR